MRSAWRPSETGGTTSAESPPASSITAGARGDNWINTISESLDGEGHYRGGVHPSVDGYRTIGDGLAGSIKMKLLGSLPPTACGPPPVAKPECVAPCGVALPWLPPP